MAKVIFYKSFAFWVIDSIIQYLSIISFFVVVKIDLEALFVSELISLVASCSGSDQLLD